MISLIKRNSNVNIIQKLFKFCSEQQRNELMDIFLQVDLRVGQIQDVWKHPDSEKLYCEKIDIGNEVREIASGLQQYISIDQMQGKVIVLANLKPRKLGGFLSNGMVLCAHSQDNNIIELIRPHQDSKIGDRIKIVGKEELFVDSFQKALNQKKKFWEKVQPYLWTNQECLITFQDELIGTLQGPLYCDSIKNGNVS